MIAFRPKPGTCPICGAAHTACTASRGPVTAVQLPARDAASSEVAPPALVEEIPAPSIVAEVVQKQLPAGRFTSGTYRGKKSAR